MIHIRNSEDGKFYFTINASNGEVVATSETYDSKQGAKKGIDAVAMAMTGDIEDVNPLNIKDHTPTA